MIGLLNYEVTPNIHPAKIMPSNAEDYIGTADWLPVATFNQKEHLVVADLFPVPTNGAPSRGISCRTSTVARRRKFEEKIVVGDSGNPSFFIIGSEPILLFCLRGGGCGCGPAVHHFRREIQKAMDELCPGYKLECFDFAQINDCK